MMPSGDVPAKILLVDDQAANLLALETALAELGQNLIPASSPEEALRRLREDDFAVVLLRVPTNGPDVLETARRIRGCERARQTPILFLAATASTQLPAARAYALGRVDILGEPLVPEALRAKVRLFVELFQKSERLRRLERKGFEQLREGEESAAWAGRGSAGPLDGEVQDLDGEVPHPAAVTAELFGAAALRESSPSVFREAVRCYERLLDLALEQREYKVPSPLAEELRAFGERLGFWKAGPRDVIDIHGAALRGKARQGPSLKVQAYAREARLLLIELLGQLAAYYRRHLLAAGWGPRNEPLPADNEGQRHG